MDAVPGNHYIRLTFSLYIIFLFHHQREFESEILSEQEEADMIHRLVRLVNHPSVAPATKLLVIQWAQYYQQIQV